MTVTFYEGILAKQQEISYACSIPDREIRVGTLSAIFHSIPKPSDSDVQAFQTLKDLKVSFSDLSEIFDRIEVLQEVFSDRVGKRKREEQEFNGMEEEEAGLRCVITFTEGRVRAEGQDIKRAGALPKDILAAAVKRDKEWPYTPQEMLGVLSCTPQEMLEALPSMEGQDRKSQEKKALLLICRKLYVSDYLQQTIQRASELGGKERDAALLDLCIILFTFAGNQPNIEEKREMMHTIFRKLLKIGHLQIARRIVLMEKNKTMRDNFALDLSMMLTEEFGDFKKAAITGLAIDDKELRNRARQNIIGLAIQKCRSNATEMKALLNMIFLTYVEYFEIEAAIDVLCRMYPNKTESKKEIRALIETVEGFDIENAKDPSFQTISKILVQKYGDFLGAAAIGLKIEDNRRKEETFNYAIARAKSSSNPVLALQEILRVCERFVQIERAISVIRQIPSKEEREEAILRFDGIAKAIRSQSAKEKALQAIDAYRREESCSTG